MIVGPNLPNPAPRRVHAHATEFFLCWFGPLAAAEQQHSVLFVSILSTGKSAAASKTGAGFAGSSLSTPTTGALTDMAGEVIIRPSTMKLAHHQSLVGKISAN